MDPLIDDMVRELKQSCVTVLWQAPRLAQFIGLDPVAVEYAEAAEAVFDFHLRHGCKTRARVSQIVDDEQFLKTPSGTKFLLTLHDVAAGRALSVAERTPHDYGITAGMSVMLGMIENRTSETDEETGE